MEISKIRTDKGDYIISKSHDIEYINPIEYYSESFIKPKIFFERELLLHRNSYSIQDIDKFLLKRTTELQEEWQKELKEIVQMPIHQNFISLLKSASKKEQIQLLKGQSLTPKQLTAFIIKAWSDFGFLFSQFSVEHLHNEKNETLPRVAEVKGASVKKFGDTTMTDGRLKDIINHRKVINAKFIDKGANWHCLFISYNSLRGRETWGNGQPHFHYISDKFELKRDKVVNDLKSKHYNLPSLPHIDLIGYRGEK